MKYTTRFLLFIFLFGLLLPARGQETVTDFDGNVYKIVIIGSRVWMAENLRVTHYRNGERIPDIKDPEQWDLLTGGACCEFNNDPVYTKAFGLLYNWYTTEDVRRLCPDGWDVPSESEWITLVSFLAGENVASEKSSGKIAPGMIKVNESIFKLLPEGFRGYESEFSGIGYGGGGWWSGTSASQETAYYHNVTCNTAGKVRMEGRKKFGYNIRCIKD